MADGQRPIHPHRIIRYPTPSKSPNPCRHWIPRPSVVRADDLQVLFFGFSGLGGAVGFLGAPAVGVIAAPKPGVEAGPAPLAGDSDVAVADGVVVDVIHVLAEVVFVADEVIVETFLP